MLLTLDMPRAAVSFRISLAHDFNNDAFGALSVEFRVINLLPRSEIQLPGGHRHDHLVVNQQALQVRVAIGLARSMMPVILAKRSQAFQPFIDVRQQSVFGIVHPDAGRDVHGGDQNHSLADLAFGERRFHLRRDVDVLPVLFCIERKMFRVKLHTPR
jgi:hypothetical protein